MSKKYLSLEEASAYLGIGPAELNRLREKNEIRAFADRGDWKFKEEDVERLLRSRQADSDPDVPLRSPGFSNEDTGELVLGDDDALSEMPTIIRKSSEDSDSDVQLMFDSSLQVPDSSADVLSESDSDVRLTGQKKSPPRPSDSDVKLVGRGDDEDSDVKLAKGAGDSNVKLVSRSGILKKSDSDSDVKLSPKSTTDSDVRITRSRQPDSDSDVQLSALAGTDSDIRIVGKPSPAEDSDSDSDVKLAGLGGTDSDIRIVDSKAGQSGILKRTPGSSGNLRPSSGSPSSIIGKKPGKGRQPPAAPPAAEQDSGISLAPQSSGFGSGFNLNPVSGGSVLDEDSGIALNQGSGILMAGESGINLGRPNDSGISLTDDDDLQMGSSDSGISLDPDSGITLDAGSSGIALDPGSSGISLEAGDSGISLEESIVAGPGSGLKPPSSRVKGRGKSGDSDRLKKLKQTDGDIDITVPMPAYSGSDDIVDTQMEVPLLDDDSIDDIKFANTMDGEHLSDSGADSTNVITLEDEGSVDEYAGTLVKKGRRDEDYDDEGAHASETFETEAVDEDEFGLDDGHLDVADEIVGEDDELGDIDVFGDEDDFADSAVSEDDQELMAPVAATRGVAAPVEQEWGTGVFVTLIFSTALMLLCGSVTFDLVRNTWHSEKANPISSVLLDSLSGMFK